MSNLVGEYTFETLEEGIASTSGESNVRIATYTPEVPASDDSDAVPAKLTLSDGTTWTKGVSGVWTELLVAAADNDEVFDAKEEGGGRRSRRRRSRRHGGSRKKRRGGSRKKRKGSNKRR